MLHSVFPEAFFYVRIELKTCYKSLVRRLTCQKGIMSKLTKEQILEMARENDVRFIRLQFTDLYGALKNVAITARQLEKALNNQCMFDGSSIEGFVRIEESDMYLRPDYDSFVIFPWRPQQNKVARLICDVYRPDQTPFEGDPRYILKKVLQEAKDMGFGFNVGPECEFFLLQPDPNGVPTVQTTDKGGYFDLGTNDMGENVRRDICLTLEDMGFEIEASHHEVAYGQHEIDFKYTNVLEACDNIQIFKLVVKTIAREHGLYATFMAKPKFGINGSGMHCNMSLFDQEGNNAFYDPKGELELSETAYHFLGGILDHAYNFTAITNPTVNSYKRLVPGYEAPVYIAWAGRNRSPLVRVPASRGKGTRLELRAVDPTANPYLALAVLLECGLDGIERKLEAPAPVENNIYMMSGDERKAVGITDLPSTLHNAVKALREDDVVKAALGQHIYTNFVETKKVEWASYAQFVSQWEIDNYLYLY